MPTLLRDLHYAVRQLRKSPGFAITAVLTLALGVGANVVVFGVINALILKPLNVPQPQSLFYIRPASFGGGSYPDYLDYRNRNATFSGTAAVANSLAAFSAGGPATKNYGYEVSGDYFDMLGVQPALGRLFHASDEHGPNSAPYIVLSHKFWQRRFNSNPHIVGTTVDLNTHPYIVIGIAPKGFHGIEIAYWPDYWVPLVNEQQIEGYNFLDQRSDNVISILGRLKPGVTARQATANLNIIASQLAKQYPVSDGGLRLRLVKPGLVSDRPGDPVRGFLTGIMLLALLVLLAACANLGSLFAARAADRSRELAIRLAVGSTRRRILRQLLTESGLVSIVGGVAGTLVATGLLGALSRWQPFGDIPMHVTVVPDARVFGIALLLSLGSGMMFGLLPAGQIWRTDAAQVMKSGAATIANFRRFTVRDALLVIQIALCTLLVTASLVALRGMQRSLHAPLGFQPHGAMLAVTDLDMAGSPGDWEDLVQKHMLEGAAQIPGVTAVGITSNTPLANCCGGAAVYRPGTTDFRYSNAAMGAVSFSFTPGYLKAAGTRLLYGRDFTWHDLYKSPKVAIVSAAFARKMFGKAPAVGQHFLIFNDKDPWEIVGVVEDAKYGTLTEKPIPAMFFPFAQNPTSNVTLLVRSTRPPAEMAAALNRMLTGINPNLPFTIRSWSDEFDFALFPAGWRRWRWASWVCWQRCWRSPASSAWQRTASQDA
jgi:predicted permease